MLCVAETLSVPEINGPHIRMSATLRDDPECRERFLHEAERASQLIDRNIAACYDVVEEDGELLLVMEYVEGQTLRQRLERRLTLEEFLNIAVQCASGLAGAHEHRVLHCDLKPENIMLTPSGQAKLLDFGLARHFVRPTDSTTSVSVLGRVGGTSGYVAPEVLCEHPVDERADIFSLGVVFYERGKFGVEFLPQKEFTIELFLFSGRLKPDRLRGEQKWQKKTDQSQE